MEIALCLSILLYTDDKQQMNLLDHTSMNFLYLCFCFPNVERDHPHFLLFAIKKKHQLLFESYEIPSPSYLLSVEDIG